MLSLSAQPFRFRYVSFQKKVHLTAWFRAFSRWGQVPVLEAGSMVLCQSAAILEYLAGTLGTFSGRDTAARQTIREWLCWDADRLAPPVYHLYGDLLVRQAAAAGRDR